MLDIVKNLYTLFNCPQFLLFAILFSVGIKCYFLRLLIPQGLRFRAALKPWMLLLGVVIGSMFGDVAWLLKLIRILFIPDIPYPLLITVVRISWGLLIIQYQSLGFFIESLAEKDYHLTAWRKVLFGISAVFCCYFLFIAFFDNNLTDFYERNVALLLPTHLAPLEIRMFRYTVLYLLNLITLPSLFLTIIKIRREKLPKILKKQLKIFMLWFMVPYLITEFLIAMHSYYASLHAHTYSIVGISTILLSYAVYYCLRKVLHLRFLNAEQRIPSVNNTTFINEFKNVLEQLSHATSEQEIERSVQAFFKETFSIGMQRTHLYVRPIHTEINHAHHSSERCKTESLIENFVTTYDTTSALAQFLRTSKVVIRDEIEFNSFYQEDELSKVCIRALDAVNADVFLPIYQQQTIVAYIIVEQFSRPQEFFDLGERDQMVVFANYLSNVINLLQNRNLGSLLQQERELREELYNKQQEINQYRECMQAFIRSARQKEIGILFYKNRRFIFGNQTAKELIGININTHEGHALTKAMKELATQVLNYKTSKTIFAHDTAGNKLVISGILNLEHNNVIITVHYPEISDIIRKKIHLLKDPTKWDYLLYLETTQSGKLINQMIPGSGEILLNFKIELLKIALHRKALILTIPEQDLLPMVEILHHISLRENLQTLNLTSTSNPIDIAVKLFGINPILGLRPTSSTQPLLEKLNGTGTLFMHNIHFLSLEVQEYLAEFIKFGFYRIFRSDQKMSSDVRIICSTDYNLDTLVQEGKLSTHLFNELKTTTLHMPSLETLPESELNSLTDGFTEQAIRTDTFKNILELSEREKDKLISSRPASLQELKTKVQQVLIQKSKKTNIYHETQFDPAYNINTPDLTHAARLGKHALKDPNIMAMLWNKFKNQNQIAAFLGVNRSSVNRRCKDYNLQ